MQAYLDSFIGPRGEELEAGKRSLTLAFPGLDEVDDLGIGHFGVSGGGFGDGVAGGWHGNAFGRGNTMTTSSWRHACTRHSDCRTFSSNRLLYFTRNQNPEEKLKGPGANQIFCVEVPKMLASPLSFAGIRSLLADERTALSCKKSIIKII